MALKLGGNLGYWGIGPAGEEALELVLAAEALGFESIWVAESYGSDVVSVLAWLAGQTKTVNLGAAILQVPARPPAAAAMAGATIDKLSGGRFLFGFGPSGRRSPKAGTAFPTPSPGGAPPRTSKGCGRSSPARGRSSTTAPTTTCRCRAARARR